MIPSRKVWHPLERSPRAPALPLEPLDQDEPADIDQQDAKLSGVDEEDAEPSDAEFYRQMRTINGRANTIGTYEVFFGDYKKLFDAAKNYSVVTKADVQRVANAYFGATNRTVGTLIPQNAPEKAKP